MQKPPTFSRPRAPRAPRAPTGFTLIEIMVVVMILGLLATMVAHSVMPHADSARVQKALVDVKQIASAARLFYAEKGRLPTIDELATPDAKGKVYFDSIPQDPWAADYVLVAGQEPRQFEVRSSGPNGQAGDDDDISSRAAN